jgi:hypothetical protein
MDSLRKQIRRTIGIFAAALAGLMFTVTPASAQSCIQDVWKAHGNKQDLTCTANDVTLSKVTNINITQGGSCVGGVCKCFLGQDVTFTADFQMDLTADTRYDIGFYVSTDGGGADGALTGACAATQVTAANGQNFINLDGAPDSCGDITGTFGSATNPQIVHHQVTMPCTDPDQNGQLELPFCTTWRQPGSNETCTQQSDAFPGSPSKCNCGIRPIDIFTETATIEVTKSASPTTIPETGGSVTYSVSVKNLATQATVTLDSLDDDIYGNITTTGHDGITATTCVPDADAATCQIGGVIAAGATCTCSFTATVPPGDTGQTVTDTVDACGTDDFGHTNLCDDDDATVTYTDVLESPVLTKTAIATTCRVDATYQVVVTNTSAQDALTLNSLSDDKFGSITAAHASGGGFLEVVSTTCGQSPGGGTLPAVIAASGNYTCSFVGRINSCNVSHTNMVTGSATDDDGATYNGNSTPPLQDSATVSITVTTP